MPTTKNNDLTLDIDEFKAQLTKFKQECALFKLKSESAIQRLSNNYEDLILLYQDVILEINQQILTMQNILKKSENYEDYKDDLKYQINSILTRQNNYLEKLKSQLSLTKTLKQLCSLNSNQLVEEAKKDNATALLIINTPELIAKFSNNEVEQIIVNDTKIANALALALTSREYSPAVAKVYESLILQVDSKEDKLFIAGKENELIHEFLIKIKEYLDTKIDSALKKKTQPWSLGYFGSHYKLNINDKKIAVPQGIHELKMHLSQLGTTSPKEILGKIQTTLNTKHKEIHDESFFQQIKRFISYIFGYHRAPNTAQEYKYLNEKISNFSSP